ncbi:MAG: S-layer homology domain-containing protein [Lysinibacillus sp.]
MKKTKRYVALTAVATIAASAFIPVANASSFTDTKNLSYKDEIEALVNEGIISGFPDKTFKPNRSLTRSDVVKILGKYMVSLGYDIPADYKTKMRFKDLTSKSSDELLQYAALVKDYKVFNGSNNELLPKNHLTNAQAANVLVRAFTEIDQFDYAKYVAEEEFLKEFLDPPVVTLETKRSIDVIDYFDIVVRDYFEPRKVAKRGAFASMLYRMTQLKFSSELSKLMVTSAVAVTSTKLSVTLSDNTVHTVYLNEPLLENVPTPVSFKIENVYYDRTVTYSKKPLQVTKVENINSGQFMIYFNQEIDLPSTTNSADLHKLMNLKRSGSNIDITFQKGELQSDRKAYKVTISSKNALSGTYNFSLTDVRSMNGQTLVDFTNTYYFPSDIERPTIVSIEETANKAIVKFSEPVSTTSTAITYKLAKNGQIVSGIEASYLQSPYNPTTNKTEIVFDLSKARIAAGEKINVTISGLRDVAGIHTAQNPFTFTIQKGAQNSEPAKISAIEQTGAKQFKLTFNKPVQLPYSYQLDILSAEEQYYYVEDIQPLEGDTQFLVTVDEFLDGEVTIESPEMYPILTVDGTPSDIHMKHTFTYNPEIVYVERTATVREDNLQYLYVYFNQPVVVNDDSRVALTGSYSFKNMTYQMQNNVFVPVLETEDANTVKILMKDLVKNYDRAGAVYKAQLQFTNVFSEYDETVANSPIQFVRSVDYNYHTEQLKLLSVQTARTSTQVKDKNLLVLQFNLPVEPTLAADKFNYDLIGYNITSVEMNPTDPTQVLLRYDNTLNKATEPYLYVWNLKADKSYSEMDVFYEKVYLSDNIAPSFVSYAVTGEQEISLTFDEALADIDSRTFHVTDYNGQTLGAKATLHLSNSNVVVLTLDKMLTPATDVTIRLTPGRVIQDLYYNEGVFPTIVRTVPSILPKK